MDFNNASDSYNYSWLDWCWCGNLSWWACFVVVTCISVGMINFFLIQLFRVAVARGGSKGGGGLGQ